MKPHSLFTHSILGRVRACASRFNADRRGVSAIEFAMIAPLMITLYLGGVEVTQGVSVNRKTTIVAHTVADLVAQDTNVTNTEMTDILAASATVASPYSATNLKVTVSSITIDSTGKATVAWSDSYNGTARSVGSTVTLPTALAVANTSLIWGEVTYSYKPMFGWTMTGTFTLGDTIYMRPRLANFITRTVS
jgi:Flp pilus assembly protein TadG